jgi:hypothetical protein
MLFWGVPCQRLNDMHRQRGGTVQHTWEQASKQARGSHVRLPANLEKFARLALACLVRSGVAACLLEARLIGVYAYTKV